MNKKKRIELPLVEPIYSTYHYQGPGAAAISSNPSIRNWFLNQVFVLYCDRKFLRGYTSPEISIADSPWHVNPHFHKEWYNAKFLDGHIHYVIKKLLDAGYYVCYENVDDFYVEGKSWYRERHFSHDGCICGYDQENKTYCIYAYDQNWRYQKFWTPQKSFELGRKASFNEGRYTLICGIKPKEEQVQFSAKIAINKIIDYLDSTMAKYPEDQDGLVFGIVVHDYIVKYLDKLYDGSIPYERMDRRVFRVIWEQKKAMLERLCLIEDELHLDHSISSAYETIVKESDNMRMIYASYSMKRRDSVLPIIRMKLLALKEKEQQLLTALVDKTKGVML